MKRSLRHRQNLKNAGIQAAINLIYKYRSRSISELYDQCNSDEWAELIYCANNNFNTAIATAFELYVKDSLELQRRDRWEYLLSFADYDYDQETELLSLFASQSIDPVNFARDLKSVLQCEHNKVNTLKMYGVPNSGKSLIAQLIVQPFISCYMNNHGSENEFFLSNMLNKTLVLCEELFVTPATCEDFKSILGGAKIDIDKKFRDKQILSRTPIIITSNYYKFGRGHLNNVDERALQSRCHIYYFSFEYTPCIKIDLPAFAHFLLCASNQDIM